MNVDIEVKGNTLVLTADKETREELTECLESYGFYPVFYDLLESHSTNGSYTPFDAGESNPFVGLTEAPCIAENMNLDDEGNYTVEGDFWYYPDYIIKCPLSELAEHGTVSFVKA